MPGSLGDWLTARAGLLPDSLVIELLPEAVRTDLELGVLDSGSREEDLDSWFAGALGHRGHSGAGVD